MTPAQPFQLRRCSKNPILVPDYTSPWECMNVFNPSVIYDRGLFHMHYRAEGVDVLSRIGYAVSTDGVNFNRLRNPVMVPDCEFDTRGVEDPRVCRIGDDYFMTYCGFAAYSGEGNRACGGSLYPMIARSRNLIDWEKLSPMVRGEDNKDHVLFPRKVNGSYLAFHRRRPDIWLAASDNLIDWPESRMVKLGVSRDNVAWEGKYIGMNGVPIETPYGWLAFYHGADIDHVYRIGVMLLDLDDPSKIISRPEAFILEPRERWECRGDVPNVVFSCCNLLHGDEVYVYYGGADHVIALATAKLDEVLDFLGVKR